jgi:hypothetical protein
MSNKLPSRGPGQPTAYKPEYCEMAKRLIARGATTVDLALHFDVDVRTIDRWVAGIPAFREAVEAARCDPAHLRGLIMRLEQARGAAVRDNRSTGHVLVLLDAIVANVAALRRLLAAREVRMRRQLTNHGEPSVAENAALVGQESTAYLPGYLPPRPDAPKKGSAHG